MNSTALDASISSGSNSRHVELYKTMRRIRTFEERVGELFARAQSAGSMLHLSIGEESAAAGFCAAMEPMDKFTTHHRGHGIFLARGADPKKMMAEIGGKEAGYCRGKGGSMHIADMGLGHLGANAIVGGGIPAIVGAGLAARHKQDGSIAVAFFGDGATGQGVLYEAMNMAALWKLPVVFCCINNQYGMGTRIDQATANPALHERAAAFGLKAETVDGLDVGVVAQASQEFCDAARAGNPGFLAIDCYRFYGHARKDKSPYRDPVEEENGRKKDPVVFSRNQIIKLGLFDEIELDALDEEIAKEMDATIDFTIAHAEPPLMSLFRDVYAPSEPEPEAVRTRINRILSND